GEGLHAAAAVGTELSVILGANLALGDFLDIAATPDPVAAKFRQARHDIDVGPGVGVRTARVVHAQRRLARGGFQVDLAHRDVERANMDLAAATDRAGGDV